MKFADFMNKLHNIQWEGYDMDSNTLVSRDKQWKLSYRIVEQEDEKFPLQVLVQVIFQGKVVMTWGCDSNESNGEFLLFFKKRKADAQRIQWQTEREAEKHGEEMWYNL